MPLINTSPNKRGKAPGLFSKKLSYYLYPVPLNDIYYEYVSLLIPGNKNLNDYSLNTKTITISGNTSVSSSQYKFSDGSIFFDGTGDYLSLGGGSPYTFLTGNFTVEFWFYALSLLEAKVLIDFRPNSQNGLYPTLFLNTNGSISYYVNSTNQILTAPGIVSTGNWYHLALTRRSQTTYLYINGINKGSFADSTSYLQPTSGRPVIGASGFNVSLNNFNGYINDLRITKEISRYNLNFSPPIQFFSIYYNVVCQLHFDDINGSTRFLDITGKKINVNGNAQISTTQHKFGGSSGYFDGVEDYINFNGESDFAFSNLEFTIECWIYITASGTHTIFDTRGAGTSGSYATIFVNTNNSLVYFTTTANRITSASGSVTLNTWHHVAVTRTTSDNIIRMFLNGILIGTHADGNAYLNGTNRPTIGCSGHTIGTNCLTGYIDELRVIKGACLYSSNFTPPNTDFSDSSVILLDPFFSSVLLLMHMDGANNSTIFTDEKTKAVTSVGGATISTNQSKFSGASAYFDGTDDYLSVGSASDWDFITEPFTIEFWAYFSSVTGTRTLITNYQNFTNGWTLQLNASKIVFNGSGDGVDIQGSTTIAINTWYHICVSGVSGSSGIRLFINGVQEGSTFTGATNFVSTSPLIVGSLLSTTYFNGYIDELRITKGSARYTSNFIVPAKPYSNN